VYGRVAPSPGGLYRAAVALDPRLPVLVGAGQVVHRAADLSEGRDPLDLMADAARAAAADAGLVDVPAVDSIRVVALLSWRYRDPARLLGDALGLAPAETVLTTVGGNAPQTLVNATAAEIQRGDLDAVLVAGGECWRTRTRARRAGAVLPWRTPPEGMRPSRTVGSDEPLSHPDELSLGIAMPVQIYPMFETALRAAAGEGLDDHQSRVADLWARFSAVAAANPFAWSRRALTADEIRTPGPANRMIGLPYPKAMNSNNDVDMAAALLMCSAEKARALGVPRDRWVFLHAAVDCHDTPFLSHRADLHSSPAAAIGGRRALELAGLDVDDVGIVDLYSCFPSAVQIGAAALGLGLDRPLTRTGGLSFAGGPWNSYVLHAVATMMSDLRQRPGEHGLVWANGGYVTKHAFGVYGTEPPPDGLRTDDAVQRGIDALPRRGLAVGEDAAGPATVEAYTVMHHREGRPETALAACRRADGRRAWARSGDEATAAALCAGEWVGRPVTIDAAGRLAI
jgi:acetyl-CoA C-acetyltransferase